MQLKEASEGIEVVGHGSGHGHGHGSGSGEASPRIRLCFARQFMREIVGFVCRNGQALLARVIEIYRRWGIYICVIRTFFYGEIVVKSLFDGLGSL